MSLESIDMCNIISTGFSSVMLWTNYSDILLQYLLIVCKYNFIFIIIRKKKYSFHFSNFFKRLKKNLLKLLIIYKIAFPFKLIFNSNFPFKMKIHIIIISIFVL